MLSGNPSFPQVRLGVYVRLFHSVFHSVFSFVSVHQFTHPLACPCCLFALGSLATFQGSERSRSDPGSEGEALPCDLYPKAPLVQAVELGGLTLSSHHRRKAARFLGLRPHGCGPQNEDWGQHVLEEEGWGLR